MQRIGLQRKQINHRRAVQAQMFLRQRIFMRPLSLQHDIDFKPRQFFREIHIFQAAQRHRHKLFTEGKILQQQLITAETAALRQQRLLLTETADGKTGVQRSAVSIAGKADTRLRHPERQRLMQGAGQRRIAIQVQRDAA